MQSRSIYEEYILLVRKKLLELTSIQDENKLDEEKVKYKNDILNWLVRTIEDLSSEILNRNRRYFELLKRMVRMTNKDAIEVTIRSASRVIINVNGPMGWLIDEVGIDWDPILDTVLIPSSQIKGAMSAAIQFKYAINKEEVPKDIQKLRDVLFGSEQKEKMHMSLVSITDAYPVDKEDKLIDRDVILPIYTEKITEWEVKPTPVHFLVIPPGVKFKFLLIIDSPRLRRILSNRETRRRVFGDLKIEFRNGVQVLQDILRIELETSIRNILDYTFNKIGIGAKTSSGYGIFEVIEYGELC